MANRIQLRRGGAQEWANANPTLAQGEIGIELDTTRLKIGDGVTAWNTLRYERPLESTTNTSNTLVQRDVDGNFSAGTITATLIGQSSTASRLASTRQVQITGDVTGTDNFDGSDNINLQSQLSIVDTLAHYDGTNTSLGTYTQVEVDAKGRIKRGFNPTSIADYGLDGSVEGSSAQPYDTDLQAIAQLNTTGLVARTSPGNAIARTINGTASQIVVNNGGGLTGNPVVDLAVTTVVAGDYNTESLTSVDALGSSNEPFGTETVNAAKFTVDDRGRLQSATNVPIATATEGSKYAAYAAGTTYVRYDIIEDSSKVYQAITGIAAGGGAPTHTDATDAGGWRYLGAATVEQKGLASFAQEDFDVDANGHVTIAAVGVDNTQLQNNRVSFADGNTKEDFELDQELTATSGYRGFNYLNYIKVNDTSGNLLVGANNTGDGGAGELDVNVRSYFSDADITLDGALNQTLDKTGDGNLTFQLTQNTATNRNFNILTTNAGSGSSNIIITAEDTVQISASEADGKVHVEDARFQDNYIATANATLNLDPGDDRAATGTVRVWGNLQIDGTTTTVNSTTVTVDDPIITLGGDTAPATDDNLDRGIEFRYYDTEARLGFYGWDTNYTDLGGHGGGYRFLHAATNTTEVFSGTDSGIIAGNVKLTTGTNSTTNTTGDLVIAGGAGITQDVNIGGLLDVDGTFRANSTSRFDDNIVLQGASKTLQLNNGSGTTKIEFQSTTGNGSLAGILDVTGNLNVNTDKFNVIAASGNTSIAGTLGVTSIATFSNNIDANGDVAIAGNIHSESTNDITVLKNSGTGIWEIQSNDYGSLKVDGGAYVAGSALIDGTLHVNGAIEVKDSATETESRLNWLQVRYRGRFGDSYQATPSYASHNTTTIRAHGGAGIERSLHVGGTGTGEGLFVGKRYSGDTQKFSVLGASGNTTIEGTLTVNDNVNFNGTLDQDGDFAVRNGTTDKFFVAATSGNTNIEGTLTVDGHTELNSTLNVDNNVTLGAQLTVTGTTEFNNTVDVDANFAVRSGSTDKMTVASSSGNIATDGTLVVQGQTTINDSLIVDAANEVFSVRNGSAVEKFGVDADNGNTNIIGTLTVGDAVQINDTLGVSDVVTFTRNTQQSITGNSISLDGAVRMSGGLGVSKNLAVGENLVVYGDFNIIGDTVVNGTTTYNAKIDITNTAEADSLGDSNVAFQVDGGGIIRKKLWAGGDFTVYDDANSRNAFFVDVSTGDATLHNDLTVGGNLTINGTTTTVNSTVTTLDDPIITLGGDTAPTTNDGKDRGVEFRYYDSTAKVGFFGLDRSSLEYVFLNDATNSSEVLSGTDGQLRAGSLNLTGSGTSLDVDANANIDGTLTVDGQIISQVSSGAALVIPNTTKINNLNADLLDSMTTASTATATTVVARDSSGDFAANIITVASGVGAAAGIQGNATTADALKTARNITVAGVVSGDAEFNGSGDITITTSYVDADITALAAMAGTGLVARTAANTYAQRSVTATASSGITITNADGVSGDITLNVASTSTNASNNLVLRDASGDFAANEITADLVGGVTGDVVGNVTGNVTGQTSDISNHDTGDLTEGSNLYYTDARADARIAAADTDALSEGSTNLYYTDARADARIAAADTGDLTEGSNLYYTNARADARIVAAGLDGGTLTGDVTGDVTGNVDGNVSGEVTLEGAAPASATATGTAGDIRYDADYIYICVATDTWKRAAISTWS
ncbi:structural protein [Synechococcus phage S-CAM8]|uniref:Structural protein n=1 Tax=Synechococcus phage S-CAM8 TaxID=754038 RepID=R9TP77_9CAUD|nr:structural protein [Synechococcus phage S-CAM8]AGN33930.1 structural protein [Synechococcus phage S-CAM8]